MAQQIKISAQTLDPEQKKVLSVIADDLAALRAAVVAITAKLDADAGVTDTTYASLCNPAALTTLK
jgi:tRNA threonylcarbamoyladenosine modification (KEOPS) complex  Pcc1 subunit